MEEEKEEKIAKGIDLLCRDFKMNFVKLINESGLPATLVSYSLKDITNTVDNVASNAIAEQEENYKKALEEREKSKGENKKNGK